MLLRFDRARSGRPVESKTVSGRARSGLFRVDFSGFRVFPDHVARSTDHSMLIFTVDLFMNHLVETSYNIRLRVVGIFKLKLSRTDFFPFSKYCKMGVKHV